jgi:hypothetical protein
MPGRDLSQPAHLAVARCKVCGGQAGYQRDQLVPAARQVLGDLGLRRAGSQQRVLGVEPVDHRRIEVRAVP